MGRSNMLIRNYTREAGVRNLESMVATVCRKVAKKNRRTEAGQQVKVEASDGKPANLRSLDRRPRQKRRGFGKRAGDLEPRITFVTDTDLEEMLGPPKYLVSKAEEQSEVGLTNGLAYTDAGGDMLQIEVSVVPGKGR